MRRPSPRFACGLLGIVCFTSSVRAQSATRTELIEPLHKDAFRGATSRQRKQGGNAREVQGLLVFDGSSDGNRQVDPQIAVGGGYVLHATNHGLIVYDKKGNYVYGVRQSAFNGGIDPKLYFDIHNRVFAFDLWNPWDKAKKKPVNISVSETSDPTGAWNTYPVPAPKGVDGGGIGGSRKWIGYSFPGGDERSFVLSVREAMAGKAATVYHFAGSLGHPVVTQDAIDDLYFVTVGRKRIRVIRVTEGGDAKPRAVETGAAPHDLEFNAWPPKAPQKGTKQLVAAGDRNPKNLVLQNGSIWFCHTVHCRGRAAVQWHQVRTDGRIVQSGLLHSETSHYIQSTLAVNAHEDVLVGFQETSDAMFVSPRLAFRRASDPACTLRKIVRLGEGKAATNGVAWGDYSGSVMDGDSLLDLWTVQSIADETGRGDCVIVRVPFARPAPSQAGSSQKNSPANAAK